MKKQIPSNKDLRMAMPRLRVGSERLIREDREDRDELAAMRRKPIKYKKLEDFLKEYSPSDEDKNATDSTRINP